MALVGRHFFQRGATPFVRNRYMQAHASTAGLKYSPPISRYERFQSFSSGGRYSTHASGYRPIDEGYIEKPSRVEYRRRGFFRKLIFPNGLS